MARLRDRLLRVAVCACSISTVSAAAASTPPIVTSAWDATDDTVRDNDSIAITSDSAIIPAPDGALAGLVMLTGLGIAYAIRHHRARRAG